MSSRFINGAKYAVSTSLAAAVAFATASNAAPPVLGTANPPANGSIVVITSGWTELNETVSRAAGQVAATSFQLEGGDTTDTDRYPAGEGAGVFQVAGDFVSLTQVRDIQTDGGEQQFFQYQYVEDANGRQRQVPTFKSAMTMKIILDYDPDQAWYDALVELDRLREPIVLREILPNGDTFYYFGYLAFNKVASKTMNENMTNTATFSLLTDPIRYDAA
jgi:hypothetical protein